MSHSKNSGCNITVVIVAVKIKNNSIFTFILFKIIFYFIFINKMTKLTKDIFYALCLILGIITYYISWNIDSSIQETTCKSSSLKTSNKLLLTVSVMLITISSLSLIGCDQLSISNKIVYSSIIIIFGILLITLGSMIIAGSKTNGCTNAQSQGTTWIIIIGLLIVFGSGYDLYSDIKTPVKTA